jgi:hypothetical protein
MKIKPEVKTICINGIRVPEPLRERPRRGTLVHVASTSYSGVHGHVPVWSWAGDEADLYYFTNGLLHRTREAAAKHIEAMLRRTANLNPIKKRNARRRL